MGPLAEIQRPSSFHPTALFLDGHRRPRLYRTCILSQSISLFKYPSELSAKPHWGEASGHFDPQIVRTNLKKQPQDGWLRESAKNIQEGRWFHFTRLSHSRNLIRLN